MIPIPFPLLLIENDEDRIFIAELYENYRKLMWKHAYSLMHQAELAEDMVHDACVALINHIGALRTMSPPALASYLIKTVRSVCCNYHVKNKTGKTKVFSDFAEGYIEDSVADDYSLEDEWLRRCSLEQVEEKLPLLDDSDRELLMDKYFMRKSDAEIARTRGISPQSVRMCLFRARRRLKALLE